MDKLRQKAEKARERKAKESQQRKEKGLLRKSFWLDADEVAMIENHKAQHGFKSNDEALRDLLKKLIAV